MQTYKNYTTDYTNTTGETEVSVYH